eukprot:TRINITY_DN2183_c0_g1_i4.p1 TRINITY_DN2183_c0_g1~~TRINITY_DN2183_c0_g1_i4.p1  ORF type:complete len:167 (-),score=25.30 TRINITY_DN2183_c0_g1_i4:154-654(-)
MCIRDRCNMEDDGEMTEEEQPASKNFKMVNIPLQSEGQNEKVHENNGIDLVSPQRSDINKNQQDYLLCANQQPKVEQNNTDPCSTERRPMEYDGNMSMPQGTFDLQTNSRQQISIQDLQIYKSRKQTEKVSKSSFKDTIIQNHSQKPSQNANLLQQDTMISQNGMK